MKKISTFEEFVNESNSNQAYSLHRMTSCGQNAAQNFIENNPNVDIDKLINDLSRKIVSAFMVKDIINNTSADVHKRIFSREYGELNENII